MNTMGDPSQQADQDLEGTTDVDKGRYARAFVTMKN
jgi:hypothetical protein